jgi:hypothetical protein
MTAAAGFPFSSWPQHPALAQNHLFIDPEIVRITTGRGGGLHRLPLRVCAPHNPEPSILRSIGRFAKCGNGDQRHGLLSAPTIPSYGKTVNSGTVGVDKAGERC